MSDPLVKRLDNNSHICTIDSIVGPDMREAAALIRQTAEALEAIDAILLANPHEWQKAIEVARAARTLLEAACRETR